MAHGICGTTCSLAFSNSAVNVTGHQFTLELAATEFDTRAFGDGEYGDYTMCAKTGTLTIQAYQVEGIDVGDTGTATLGLSTISIAAPFIVQSMSYATDAKGLVEFSIVSRVTGDVTIS